MSRTALIDGMGRPLERRREQGLIALGIVFGWLAVMSLVFWATKNGAGEKTAAPVPWLLAIFVFCVAAAEKYGRQKGLVWVASAFGIVGPLSLGFALSLMTPELRAAAASERLASISGTASIAMCFFLFRYRLPGLVSPVVTFAVVSVFLTLNGMVPESLRKVEGFSPRGILAALLQSPLWAGLAGMVAFGAVCVARKLDIDGDDFGLATARPLHIIGAGIAALVFGRMLSVLPGPLDFLTLSLAWIGAYIWTLRINRFAVVCTIHLAMAKPMIYSILGPYGITLSIGEFSWVITGMLVFNLVIWPWLHERSLRANWTLGPGGRIPRRRNGLWWRYWPYA